MFFFKYYMLVDCEVSTHKTPMEKYLDTPKAQSKKFLWI